MNRELAVEIVAEYLAPEGLSSEVFLKMAKNGR
jgi:hypothetical protein